MKTLLLITLTLLIYIPLESSILTLQEARQRVLIGSPSLAVSAEAVEISGAEIWQARLVPNPAIRVAGENLGGISKNSDTNECFLGVAQLVELGGKRAARLDIASANKLMAVWDYEILKNDLLNRLQHSFIDAAMAQENLNLIEEQCQIARECMSCLSEKVAHGKITKAEEKKAELRLRTLQLAANRTRGQLEAAKKVIASLWGDCNPDFDCVAFSFYDLPVVQSKESLCQQSLALNADYQRLVAQAGRACSQIRLQKAYMIPDVVVSAGLGVYESDKRHPVTIGIDFPLPILNQNQGNRCKASHEYTQAMYEITDFEIQLNAELTNLLEAWEILSIEALTLKESILPYSEEAVKQAQESYEEGKTEYLEVLEAQKMKLEVKLQYLNVLADCHHKKADIEKLTYSYDQE